MKTVMYTVAVTLWLITITTVQAQNDKTQTKIEHLQQSKETIVEEEKDALKKEVERINQQLEENVITPEEADKLKQEVAQKRALNIENKLAIVDNKIELLKRNGNDTLTIGRKSLVIGIFSEGETVKNRTKEKQKKYDIRTYNNPVLAFGINNVIGDGATLGNSDFKLGGSRFFEMGWEWETRVFKNTNWLRVNYGFSFQFNGLKPTGDRFFVDTGDQTELQTHPQNLKKSKFRVDNLVFPVHFELGPSTKVEKENYIRYHTYNKIKVGLGGYAGFNLGTRQKLSYKLDGETINEKIKSSFNTNDFIYGLSGYIGWKDMALYAKYDLNPLFKNNPVEVHNLSLGIRWVLD